MTFLSSFGSRALPLAAALFSFAGAVQAQYLWLQREGPVFEARLGELGKSSQPLAIPGATAAPAADGDLRMVTSRIDNTSGAPALIHYQARFGRAETKAVNDLELVPTEPDGNTFKLVWKGNTVPASQVNVDTSEGWRRMLKPGKDGTVTLGTPFPGLYLLEVTARVDGAVTVDGKKYEDVRHTATLSFEVPR